METISEDYAITIRFDQDDIKCLKHILDKWKEQDCKEVADELYDLLDTL